jgi:hypothetical protein
MKDEGRKRALPLHSSFCPLPSALCLLPIWIAAYEYHGKPYRFLVNGVTGKADGQAPWSWIKITLLVMAIIIIAVIVLSLTHK